MTDRKKRHRGVYQRNHVSPYELSRTRVENFVKCPACFYLQQVKGVQFPSTPGFNINEATDVLLKRDFDVYRESGKPHPYLKQLGLDHLVPFKHPDFELWTQSLHFGAEGRLNWVHTPTNLKIGGGLDDVWIDTASAQLHVVDYKSTSLKSPGKKITLDDPWKGSYKRQMDLYVWLLRKKGFDVSNTGFFLYCDGDRFTDENFLNETSAVMQFKIYLINYEVDTNWIEPTLYEMKKTLELDFVPDHSRRCEYGSFLQAIGSF